MTRHCSTNRRRAQRGAHVTSLAAVRSGSRARGDVPARAMPPVFAGSRSEPTVGFPVTVVAGVVSVIRERGASRKRAHVRCSVRSGDGGHGREARGMAAVSCRAIFAVRWYEMGRVLSATSCLTTTAKYQNVSVEYWCRAGVPHLPLRLRRDPCKPAANCAGICGLRVVRISVVQRGTAYEMRRGVGATREHQPVSAIS